MDNRLLNSFSCRNLKKESAKKTFLFADCNIFNLHIKVIYSFAL